MRLPRSFRHTMQPALPMPSPAARKACEFPSWYSTFKAHTIESTVIPLPAEFLAFLNSDGVVVPPDAFGKHQHTEADEGDETKWDEDEEETKPMRFPQLEQQIGAVIAEYGLAFPKLNWSAPRDATWISVDGSLRCRTPGEVFLFLKSSELLSGDIETAAEHGSPVVLVLRKWTQIDEGAEFRCFVKDNRLRGISQRHHSVFFPYVKELKTDAETLIERFFNTVLLHKFPVADYVFDVYIDHRRQRVRLLDFAPFGVAEPLLFEYEEFAGDRNPTDELIRVVEKATHILPSPLAQFRLPRDPIDVSTADAIENLSRHLREQSEAEAKQP